MAMQPSIYPPLLLGGAPTWWVAMGAVVCQLRAAAGALLVGSNRRRSRWPATPQCWPPILASAAIPPAVADNARGEAA